MLIPLSEVIQLPEKKKVRGYTHAGHGKGWNSCLSALPTHIEIDEEKMAEIISDEWYEQLGKNINRGQATRLFSKALLKKKC